MTWTCCGTARWRHARAGANLLQQRHGYPSRPLVEFLKAYLRLGHTVPGEELVGNLGAALPHIAAYSVNNGDTWIHGGPRDLIKADVDLAA
jgi:hypothetical protein